MSTSPTTQRFWRLVVGLLAFVSGGLLACAPPTGKLRGAAPPVILISIDTLRSDRLPAYGYDGVATPAIDALRQDSILFERAYTPYPLTLPAHASILTGLLPPDHGVRDNAGYRLADEVPHLAQQLSDFGYRTGAAVSSFVLRSDSGLGRGFEFYEDALDVGGEGPGEGERNGLETQRRAIAWIRSVQTEPFFFLLHLFEPHTPYSPPEPFLSRYPDPYNGEIAAVDAIVGEFLDQLRQLDLYDRSLIILLSDHGEGLGEHGEPEHGLLLHRSTLQVPLLLKLPAPERAGESIAEPVSLIEVQPTIAALVGLADAPKNHLLNLAASSTDERYAFAESFYARLQLGASGLRSVIDERHHYIDGPRPELYDLLEDPAETENLLASRRSDAARLKAWVQRHHRPLEPPAPVDPEVAQQLQALGYLSTSQGLTADESLPDPKSQLVVFEGLRQAARLLLEHQPEEAAATLQQLVGERPGVPAAWEQLGQALLRSGRLEESADAYRRAIDLGATSSHTFLAAARVYIQMQRWDDAEVHARQAAASDQATAYGVLAEMALARGDLETAEAHARTALAARNSTIAPYLTLAQLALRRRQFDEALEHAERAEVEQLKRHQRSPIPGLYYLKAESLAAVNRYEEAIESFRQEIQAHPQDPRAYGRLAMLHAFLKQPDESTQLLHQLVETVNSPAAIMTAVRTWQALGENQRAQRVLNAGLDRFPTDPQLRALSQPGRADPKRPLEG